MFEKAQKFFRDHTTKVLGFAQVTLAVFAGSTDLFSPNALKIIMLASGLATAWRGFASTANQNQDK